IGSVLCVMRLSANTSFVDFPRVCRLVAEDDFLPGAFAVVGRRLVFSVGILYLAVTAEILLVVFGGISDRLIPFFAIDAFLTFTMSQAGMLAHWRRELRKTSSSSARHNKVHRRGMDHDGRDPLRHHSAVDREKLLRGVGRAAARR